MGETGSRGKRVKYKQFILLGRERNIKRKRKKRNRLLREPGMRRIHEVKREEYLGLQACTNEVNWAEHLKS
jgi:hypothetical protein